jgi:hypothetical protein
MLAKVVCRGRLGCGGMAKVGQRKRTNTKMINTKTDRARRVVDWK